MARTFTAASSEKITLGLGALGFAFGPGTIAAVVRTPAAWSGVAMSVVTVGAANATGYGMRFGITGGLTIDCDNTVKAPGSPLATSSLYLVAVTKATGAVFPRVHDYNYSTKVATHVDAGTTLANSSVPITRAALGVHRDGTTLFYSGDLACAAVWNVVLTDSQIESLITDLGQSNWVNASGDPAACKAFWQLTDPVATSLIDRTGGGANQSAIVGTTLAVDDMPLLRPSMRQAPSPAWVA